MRRGIFVGTATLGSIIAMGGSVAMAAPGPASDHAPVCSHALPGGQAGCDAIQLLNPAANWHGVHVPGDPATKPGKGPGGGSASTTPSGYGPADLHSAYGLTESILSGGGTQTVAIVDAYDDPNAASDLSAYRSQYGLGACTTASGCFRKVNQNGGTSYPRGNSGWAEEISLDLDMVSAICPKCKILLVEASSNSFANLGAAENYAAAHANAVSNSYGGGEFSSEATTTYDGPFNHPGVVITASSGDGGYGVEFPAASQYVTAVGGTTLNKGGLPRGWNETAWSGAGSGCSAYIPKPSWQTDAGCAKRTVADVSADANPNTGVAVYDTYRTSGWLVFGGTSVASPIVASVYALAGNGASVSYGSFPYSHTSSLFDVTSGANGSCGGSYLCTAGSGFDGPTGLGTPNGTAAF